MSKKLPKTEGSNAQKTVVVFEDGKVYIQVDDGERKECTTAVLLVETEDQYVRAYSGNGKGISMLFGNAFLKDPQLSLAAVMALAVVKRIMEEPKDATA